MNGKVTDIVGDEKGFAIEIDEHFAGKKTLVAKIHQVDEDYAAIAVCATDSHSDGCIMLEQENSKTLERAFLHLGLYEEGIVLTPRLIQYNGDIEGVLRINTDRVEEIELEMENVKAAILQLDDYWEKLTAAKYVLEKNS